MQTPRTGRPSLEAAAGLRQHILDVALELLCRSGAKAVTMNDIAQAAQVSKRTLYTRFADRDRMVLEAVEHGLERLVTPLFELPRHATSLEDQLLYIGCEMLTASLREDVLGLERLLHDLAQQDAQRQHELQSRTRDARVRPVQAALDRAAARGEIDAQVAAMAAPLIFDVLVTHPRRELPFDIALQRAPGREAYLRQVVALLLGGLRKAPAEAPAAQQAAPRKTA